MVSSGKKTVRVAVIYFPGMNCEDETKRSCEAVGMECDIVRWNVDPCVLEKYDGYVLGGGWSYEDRIRAGVVSAKDPVMLKIKEEAAKGKAVLGICNGAQVLVESGLIPGLRDTVEVALAPNNGGFVSGYYCTWVHIKQNARVNIGPGEEGGCAFGSSGVMPIIVAHGEGRFVTKDPSVLEELKQNGQVLYQYCDVGGEISEEFPITPNGSMHAIAALCNKQGNVMAMMPHPERCVWNKQIPYYEGKDFSQCEDMGPGAQIFCSMKEYLEVTCGSWRDTNEH